MYRPTSLKTGFPCAHLIKHYAMKEYGEVDVYIHIILTSVLVGGEWLASHPGRFNSGEIALVPIIEEAG
jgi:hypothetical protein